MDNNQRRIAQIVHFMMDNQNRTIHDIMELLLNAGYTRHEIGIAFLTYIHTRT